MESALIDHAKSLAEEVFKDPVFEKYFFHNLRHTEDVVSAVKDIGMRSELSADEMELALVAAWLHDLGYKYGAENHEDSSARHAEEFMDRLSIPPKKIKAISSAILSTRLPQQPRTLIERVLCDADLFHLSNQTFEAKSELLRKEWKATGFREMTDQEWETEHARCLGKRHFGNHRRLEQREKILPVQLEQLTGLQHGHGGVAWTV